ncbi:MAG: hypothetical protein M9928_03670 [Anaerolineae bacterium]|nr:hypothetical protein [Anaerolineae bacterium]MCO5191329.1 hypothetical protein [Anaerolineae bacterium]MCO5192222.1 hypothetical protein [Anaerolineae bacterium]MCO5198344.1 hypothetical protein [Anaerolineae bacterium]MCO5204104.1 hypothetical protein [Anaerolineae bacterium]
MDEQLLPALQRLENMLNMITATEEDECDCAYVDDVMDEIAELMAQGVDIAPLMPAVYHHLQLCDCCHAEVDVLLNILESAETNTTP